MNKIHDKTDEKHWTNNVVNWKSKFNSGDIVIGRGWDHFKTMFVVHEIDLEDNLDYVTHRGVFWDETEARVYADTLVEK